MLFGHLYLVFGEMSIYYVLNQVVWHLQVYSAFANLLSL